MASMLMQVRALLRLRGDGVCTSYPSMCTRIDRLASHRRCVINFSKDIMAIKRKCLFCGVCGFVTLRGDYDLFVCGKCFFVRKIPTKFKHIFVLAVK